MPPISRRLILQTSLAAGALTAASVSGPPKASASTTSASTTSASTTSASNATVGSNATASSNAQAAAAAEVVDEFGLLRARWVELATGGAIDPADPAYSGALANLTRQAQGFLDTLSTDPNRTALWTDLPLSASSGNFSISYTRLKTIALARATHGTTLTGDPAAALAGALDFLNRHAYNETLPETGNWWFWEIGAPRALLDICILAYDVLSADQRAAYLKAVDRFVPDPNRRTNYPSVRETGANRVDKALIVALRGIAGDDAAKIAAARDALSDVAEAGKNSVFTYVTSGDGFYRDGSFVQHGNLAYVGTYGNVALGGVANLFSLLGGSTWDITDPNRAVILDAVEASFAPFMVNGLMMDAVSGRAISREKAGDHRNGHSTTSAVLLLASGIAEPYASTYRALAKGWLTRDRLNDYLPAASIPEISRAQAVLADKAVKPAPAKPQRFQFPNQDRVVHRRPGWTFALALSSRRMARYESGNGENLRGWYVGDGMTYLYTDDQSQFSDAFWPTVDAQRLPGTTVSGKPREPLGSGPGTGTVAAYADWVGGASYRDTIGAVGMHLINHDKSLQARKSWFCLSDAVVALGAGIIGTDGYPVETVVENRRSAAQLLVDGRTATNRLYDGPRWAHLHGVGGYLFLGKNQVRVHREDRTGSWSEINVGNDTAGSTTPYTRHYQSLVVEHGLEAGDYAYVLLPGVSAWQTALRSLHSGISILANTATVQAIRADRDRVTMANFWGPGSVGGITVDGPASVVVGPTMVAVSDPSRTATTVRVTIERPTGPPLVLDVAVGGTRGATQSFDRSW